MTHTQIAYRQQRGPIVTVVDGVLNIDGDFIVTNYAGPAACIQAAIDSIKSTGGTVYIKAGTYILEDEIDISSVVCGLTITGDGDATVIKQPEVYNPLFVIGDVGTRHVDVTRVAGVSITFTKDSGNFAFTPVQGDVLYIPGTSGFNVANQGAFSVTSATSSAITVKPRINTGGAGLAETTINVAAIGDMSIVGGAFRLTSTHDVTIEKLHFERTSGDNSFGSFIFADSCTANIVIQDNFFVDSSLYFGHDVVLYGAGVWGDTQGNRILNNRFSGDSNNSDGDSDGIRIFQSQHDLKINDNWFRDGIKSSYIVLSSPEANTLQHGWNIDVFGNYIDTDNLTPDTLYPVMNSNGIVIDGWWDSVICNNNRIRVRISKSNVAFRAIYGSNIGNVGTLALNHQFSGNDIAIFRITGSSNTGDRCFNLDYSGNSGPCMKVKLSDNAAEFAMGAPYTTTTATLNSYFRQINDLFISSCRFIHAAIDCVQIRNGDSANVNGCQFYMTTTGNAALVFESWVNAVVSGNEFNSARNYGVYITGGSGFVVAGNLINCLTVPVVCNGTVSSSTIGPNQGQHETALQSCQESTGYNINKQIVKAWAQTTQAGVVTEGYNLACSHVVGSSTYTYTMSRSMASEDFVIMVCAQKAFDYNITAYNHAAPGGLTTFTVRTWNTAGVGADCGHCVMVCGLSN